MTRVKVCSTLIYTDYKYRLQYNTDRKREIVANFYDNCLFIEF